MRGEGIIIQTTPSFKIVQAHSRTNNPTLELQLRASPLSAFRVVLDLLLFGIRRHAEPLGKRAVLLSLLRQDLLDSERLLGGLWDERGLADAAKWKLRLWIAVIIAVVISPPPTEGSPSSLATAGVPVYAPLSNTRST